MRTKEDTDIDRALPSRRRVLRKGAAIGGAALAGAFSVSEARAESAGNLPPNVPEWMKTPGDPMGSQPYGAPSPFEKNVVKNISKNLKQYISASGRTPLQDLDGIITPNGLFYERHHGGVPTIDPAQHRLMLHGLVDRPLIFTMDDIRRFPSQSRIHFIECSGTPVYTKPYGKTASDLVGLVSCAEWTGVSLKLVLQEAGLQPAAKWVVAEGADAAALTRSIPIEKCLEDAMLVYSQNGERLRLQQGYPLRLLVPGFEGNMNVKWLRRLHVMAEPAHFSRGDLEIHRSDAGLNGARVHLLHGGQVHHHAALRRAALDGTWLPRDHRHCLERSWPNQARRRFG
jgi:sulfane dehydrogenase subunit SoxC